MTTVRALDPVTGDIVTSGYQFLSGRQAVSQTVQTRLKLILGEYFRDVKDGTDWFGTVLGKGSTLSNRESVLKNRIARTAGVNQITAFSASLDVNARTYSITVSILTDDGLIELNSSLGA